MDAAYYFTYGTQQLEKAQLESLVRKFLGNLEVWSGYKLKTGEK